MYINDIRQMADAFSASVICELAMEWIIVKIIVIFGGGDSVSCIKYLGFWPTFLGT